MSKMMTLWMVGGGSALAGATLTYLATRTGLTPVTDAAGRSVDRLKSWWTRGERASPAMAASRTPAAYSPAHNSAFEEYRASQLNKLDSEEKEFRDYLDRLRHAKDREEFDQFIADRRKTGTNVVIEQ